MCHIPTGRVVARTLRGVSYILKFYLRVTVAQEKKLPHRYADEQTMREMLRRLTGNLFQEALHSRAGQSVFSCMRKQYESVLIQNIICFTKIFS